MYYGIYKITNKVNGKMYIGQHTTDDLDDGVKNKMAFECPKGFREGRI